MDVLLRSGALFAVTNLDDIVVLGLLYARARGSRAHEWSIAAGQYAGFAAIVIVAIAVAGGATLLPASAVAYAGLLPIALGLRAGLQQWHGRGRDEHDDDADERRALVLSMPAVAAVTFANGGDNIGVYAPVFATQHHTSTAAMIAVFLALVALLCAAGRYAANHQAFTGALDRWGDVLLPVVLVVVGVLMLVEGGAFGLG